MTAWYKKFFSIEEIEQSKYLQVLYWVLLIGFFLSFAAWSRSDQASIEIAARGFHLCPPYFLNCADFYITRTLAATYGQAILYMLLMLMLVSSAIAASFRRWEWAHAFLLLPTVYKIIYPFFLDYSTVAEFEYFHTPVVLVFLLVGCKGLFARCIFVVEYIFSATAKFNETWIVGGYFSALVKGLAFFPNSWIPYVTNGVILFEIFSPWFLFSKKKRIRWIALALWLMFHVYSFLLIGYLYPAYCIPILLALFLRDPDDEKQKFIKPSKKKIGYALLLGLITLHVIPWFIPGNKLYSLQGRRLGVQMFDGNHQVVSEELTVYKDGRKKLFTYNSSQGVRRASPYVRFFYIHQMCKNPEVKAIQWKFNSSLNGGPFYRLVDVADACQIRYTEFGRNDWLKFPEAGAPVVGYPRKNYIFIDTPLPLIHSDPEPGVFTDTQEFLKESHKKIEIFYWILWFSVTFYFLVLRRITSKFPDKISSS